MSATPIGECFVYQRARMRLLQGRPNARTVATTNATMFRSRYGDENSDIAGHNKPAIWIMRKRVVLLPQRLGMGSCGIPCVGLVLWTTKLTNSLLGITCSPHLSSTLYQRQKVDQAALLRTVQSHQQLSVLIENSVRDSVLNFFDHLGCLLSSLKRCWNLCLGRSHSCHFSDWFPRSLLVR